MSLSAAGIAFAALGGKRAEKRLRTAIDETCILFDTVFGSGGKRGLDAVVAPMGS